MRLVVRCLICNLVQYETRNGRCRRCNRPFPAKIDPPLPALLPPEPPKPDVTHFGSSLAFYRKVLDVGRLEVRRRCGVGTSTISKIEHNHAMPSVGLAAKIIEALDLPSIWFFEAPNQERAEQIFAWRVIEEMRVHRVSAEIVERHIAEVAKMRRILMAPPPGLRKVPRDPERHYGRASTRHSAL